MDKNRSEADKQPKQQSVLSGKEELGGEAEKKLKQMGESSSGSEAKADNRNDKK